MSNTLSSPAIVFTPVSEPAVDAFTGGPVVGALTLCAKCLCCYGAESREALNEHNEGKCMGCGEILGAEAAS
jgi:hypothetical protein